jgi:hypothetical protein
MSRIQKTDMHLPVRPSGAWRIPLQPPRNNTGKLDTGLTPGLPSGVAMKDIEALFRELRPNTPSNTFMGSKPDKPGYANKPGGDGLSKQANALSLSKQDLSGYARQAKVGPLKQAAAFLAHHFQALTAGEKTPSGSSSAPSLTLDRLKEIADLYHQGENKLSIEDIGIHQVR